MLQLLRAFHGVNQNVNEDNFQSPLIKIWPNDPSPGLILLPHANSITSCRHSSTHSLSLNNVPLCVVTLSRPPSFELIKVLTKYERMRTSQTLTFYISFILN